MKLYYIYDLEIHEINDSLLNSLIGNGSTQLLKFYSELSDAEEEIQKERVAFCKVVRGYFHENERKERILDLLKGFFKEIDSKRDFCSKMPSHLIKQLEHEKKD